MARRSTSSRNKAAPCVNPEALSTLVGCGGGGRGETRDLSALNSRCADVLLLPFLADRGGEG
jgi:hypothetical protein